MAYAGSFANFYGRIYGQHMLFTILSLIFMYKIIATAIKFKFIKTRSFLRLQEWNSINFFFHDVDQAERVRMRASFYHSREKFYAVVTRHKIDDCKSKLNSNFLRNVKFKFYEWKYANCKLNSLLAIFKVPSEWIRKGETVDTFLLNYFYSIKCQSDY